MVATVRSIDEKAKNDRRVLAAERKMRRDFLCDALEAHMNIVARLLAIGATEVNTGMLAAKFSARGVEVTLEAPEVETLSPEERRRREEAAREALLFHSAG